MTEQLNPYEVCQIAANDRTARFEVTITGTLDAVEMDSSEGVKITVDNIEIPLHYNYTVAGPQPRANVKVRRIDV